MNSIALSKRKDFAVYRATWVFVAALCLLILQALQATAQMLPNTFADLADEISPSVVNITTTTVIAGRADRKSTRLNSSHLKLSRMPSSA